MPPPPSQHLIVGRRLSLSFLKMVWFCFLIFQSWSLDEVQTLNGVNRGVLQVWALTECCLKLCFALCCIGQAGSDVSLFFAEHNQQDATFLNLFISVRRSTCFRRVFRPSSGAQNCTYSVRYLSDQYCYLLLAWPGQQLVAVLV